LRHQAEPRCDHTQAGACRDRQCPQGLCPE
jgi:hypothetical protein